MRQRTDKFYVDALKKYMALTGIDQEILAQKLGVSKTAVDKWLIGHNGITHKNRTKIELLCVEAVEKVSMRVNCMETSKLKRSGAHISRRKTDMYHLEMLREYMENNHLDKADIAEIMRGTAKVATVKIKWQLLGVDRKLAGIIEAMIQQEKYLMLNDSPEIKAIATPEFDRIAKDFLTKF